MRKLVLFACFSILAYASGGNGGNGGGTGGGGGGGTVPAAPNALSLRVSSEVGPPGSIVQVKLLVTNPKPIVTGTFAMDFNSFVFDDILGISVMSANNDAYGVASYSNGRLSFEVKSASGSIGLLPTGYPLVTVAVRIKATAPIGSQTQVAMNLSATTIQDLLGGNYVVEVTPGTVTVGGSLAIGDVVPGGGSIKPGDTIQLTGVGFDTVTSLRIDAADKPTWQIASKNLINVRSSTSFALDATRIVIKNKAGETNTYYSYPRSHFFSASGATWSTVLKPLLPGRAVAKANIAFAGKEGALAIWNPRFVDQIVQFEAVDASGRSIGSGSITVAARSTLTSELTAMGLLGVATLRLETSDGVGVMGIAHGLADSPIIPTILVSAPY